VLISGGLINGLSFFLCVFVFFCFGGFGWEGGGGGGRGYFSS